MTRRLESVPLRTGTTFATIKEAWGDPDEVLGSGIRWNAYDLDCGGSKIMLTFEDAKLVRAILVEREGDNIKKKELDLQPLDQRLET